MSKWTKIRDQYLGGRPLRELCEAHGISQATLYRRKRQEGWGPHGSQARLDDECDQLDALAESLAGEGDTGITHVTKPAAEASDARAELLARRRHLATESHLYLAERLRGTLLRIAESGAWQEDAKAPRHLNDLVAALARLQQIERTALQMDQAKSLQLQAVIIAPAKRDADAWHEAASSLES